jgi:hypothetical protein
MYKNRNYKKAKEFYSFKDVPSSNLLKEKYTPIFDNKPTINMKWNVSNFKNGIEPEVWGPSLWFSLHNGCMSYPIKASKIVSDKMKGFVMGLPYIIPCADCSEHARAHIEFNYNKLDNICSGRDNLFEFFCNMHNYVNKRFGKPVLSVEEAKKIYSGGVNVMKMSY